MSGENSIEKILDFRLAASVGAVRQHLADSQVCEYLCKLKARAHMHARWLSAAAVEANGRLSAQRLVAFERKRAAGDLEPFNKACMEVERIIAADAASPLRSSAISNAPSSVHSAAPARRYLVKWCGLAHDQSTWEDAGCLPPQHIDDFWAREAAIASSAPSEPMDPAAADTTVRGDGGGGDGVGSRAADTEEGWRDLPDGVLREGRTLRDYQLEGL